MNISKKSKFSLSFVMALAVLSGGQESKAQDVAALLEGTVSPESTEAKATYPWYFLGCARTQNDCRWEAGNRGYYRYSAQRDLFTCRHVFHTYACYGAW